MVQYRDLNAPPARTLAEIVADMRASERQSKTGDAGVKDLGESGDVVWPRTDGEVASIRDVDLELADARQRIEDAEGDLAGAQARIDTALDAEGHVREDEILRNATLLGETVVEQINVTDKLVGTDGVFTGTVDFANVNVTGELLANEISGEHIYGTVVEGGEIRTSSNDSRGAFLLGDRAYVSPLDGYAAPGIRFAFPGDTRQYPAGIGIDSSAVAISGGRRADDAYTRLNVGSGGVSALSSPSANDVLGWASSLSVTTQSLQLRTGPPGSAGGDLSEVFVAAPLTLNGEVINPPQVRLSATYDGKRARIEARDGVTTVEASNGTTSRALKVDDTGVWVQTNKSGSQEAWNLEETANDTGWINFNTHAGITATGNPALRLKGGVVYFRGILTKTGTWEQGWTPVAGPFNSKYRPATSMRVPGAITDDRRTLLNMGADGIISVYMSAALGGTASVPLTPLTYVLG